MKTLVVATSKPWRAQGIGAKPPSCSLCPCCPKTHGFIYDYVGRDPKLAVVFPSPSKDEVNERTPLAGNMGWWFLKHFIEPLGYTKENLVISYVLRCKQPWSWRKKGDDYPTGRDRELAETRCRQYDGTQASFGVPKQGGLKAFAPNLALLTFEPKDVFKVNAYYRQIQVDFQKAKRFVECGYRPVVLCGTEAGSLIFKWIEGAGGAKSNRGTFEELENGWPF